ncbi:putative L-lactate permease [Selenomonas ruminantium subsp. lactilytica TAM6421]|uniref:L-lactate permease n=1 Tax=Selenomonas ruminantium subsp. lactilytica (strain NBRC 103574 / TAM6421) TaxID=927704 RepID=I0GUC3_SELRL|nr:lactate permease LctP family transporter [Selenomonas ruminantium]BAL84360.1 putative L-lactate permease [Selenomonas ruminantium subsp. lactilytica TAM6421]
MTLLFFAILPILWLIVALSGLKMAAWKACPVALLLSLFASVIYFGMPFDYMASAVLEGTALACWPILLIITATIYTYHLSVHTGGMEIIKAMLNSVSSDYRVLILLIAFGFGGFLEGMAGFGTAVAIPASMLAGMGINPVSAVAVCLVANFVPSAYGSIGIPLVTLSGIMGTDSAQLATYVALQICILGLFCPFLMVAIAGGGLQAIKGMVSVCAAAGVSYVLAQLGVSYFLGPELAGVAGAICTMGAIIGAVRLFSVENEAYVLQRAEMPPVTKKQAILAWLPFVLIFVLLLLTSKLVPTIYDSISQIRTSVLIYKGEGGSPYTFHWIATPGMVIFFATFVSGLIKKTSVADMVQVLGKTVLSLRPTFITIISIIATAKVMGYSGMTTTIADNTVAATGLMYPAIAAFIGSVGGFITGSATSTCILLGKLQMDAAVAIGAPQDAQIWIAAANATGACAGKLIAPQSIAIGVAAIGVAGRGSESRLLALSMKVYLPFIILLGLLVYFGGALL